MREEECIIFDGVYNDSLKVGHLYRIIKHDFIDFIGRLEKEDYRFKLVSHEEIFGRKSTIYIDGNNRDSFQWYKIQKVEK